MYGVQIISMKHSEQAGRLCNLKTRFIIPIVLFNKHVSQHESANLTQQLIALPVIELPTAEIIERSKEFSLFNSNDAI
jgi:hypothetical protein